MSAWGLTLERWNETPTVATVAKPAPTKKGARNNKMIANIPMWVDFLVCHALWPITVLACVAMICRTYRATHKAV